MTKGISVHIGVNNVRPEGYAGWNGLLRGCEADARAMAAIAASRGFADTQRTVLLTEAATRDAVIAAIASAARALKAGDLFFLSYSGHGGQLPDLNGDEEDGLDETWCLHDAQLVDDEVHALLTDFDEGVRVIVVSDSCHSGTVLKSVKDDGTPVDGVAKHMPRDVIVEAFRANTGLYTPILRDAKLAGALRRIRASCIFLSSCQDHQRSLDLPTHGLFTKLLLEVWSGGAFGRAAAPSSRSHAAFHAAIRAKTIPSQTPNLTFEGIRSPGFEAQVPFTIVDPTTDEP